MNIKNFKPLLINKLNENNFFYLSIFLLPSAPFISSIIFLFLAIKLSFRKKGYFSDKWNIPFFYSGLLIIFSCFSNYINRALFYNQTYESNLIWIGIFNWIPYFWVYWLFQEYTSKPSERYKVGIFLLFGSFPVILTNLAQYFLKIEGPFTLFQGAITWYLRTPQHIYSGLTGLFNNSNINGAWLNIIFPFSLILFFEKNNFFKKMVSSFISFLIIFCIIFTYSRNAIFGLIIGSIIVCGYRILKWILPTLIAISIPIITSIGMISNQKLIDISRKIVPEMIWGYRFNAIEYNDGRLQIWNAAKNFILEKPLWGWGSSSFPILYEETNNIYVFHTHNLALELAISFGIPVTIILVSAIILIFYFSKEKIFIEQQQQPYDLAWWVSAFLILISQMFDIQYFDIRIGLTFWLLLGGLRNIIRYK